MFIVLRRKDKEVAIKMESLAPEAAPTEEDALVLFTFLSFPSLSSLFILRREQERERKSGGGERKFATKLIIL